MLFSIFLNFVQMVLDWMCSPMTWYLLRILVRFISDDGIPLYKGPWFIYKLACWCTSSLLATFVSKNQGRNQHYYLVQTGSLAGKCQRWCPNIVSRGLIELKCIWMHWGKGFLKKGSTDGMFPSCCPPFWWAEQEKNLIDLGMVRLRWCQTVWGWSTNCLQFLGT